MFRETRKEVRWRRNWNPISDQVEEEDRIPDRIVGQGPGTVRACDPGRIRRLRHEHPGAVPRRALSGANACFRTLMGTNNGIGSTRFGGDEAEVFGKYPERRSRAFA